MTLTAALFPGQGSQFVGMAKDFYEKSPAAKAVLDEAEVALPGLLDIMWHGPEEVLKLTINQQPALVAAGAAAFAAYQEAGQEMPSYVAGHSLGEFTAYVVAGSLTVARAVQLVRKRGQYMQEAVPASVGAMAAVMKVTKDIVEKVCVDISSTGTSSIGTSSTDVNNTNINSIVEIANLNSETQTVISGEAAAVNKAGEALKLLGAKVIPLAVSAPFHCSLMQGAADKLAQDLVRTKFQPLNVPIITNVSADILTNPEEIPQLLTTQVTHTVRWMETIQKLHILGVENFVEFGAGKVLTGLVKRIVKGTTTTAVYDMSVLAKL